MDSKLLNHQSPSKLIMVGLTAPSGSSSSNFPSSSIGTVVISLSCPPRLDPTPSKEGVISFFSCGLLSGLGAGASTGAGLGAEGGGGGPPAAAGGGGGGGGPPAAAGGGGGALLAPGRGGAPPRAAPFPLGAAPLALLGTGPPPLPRGPPPLPGGPPPPIPGIGGGPPIPPPPKNENLDGAEGGGGGGSNASFSVLIIVWISLTSSLTLATLTSGWSESNPSKDIKSAGMLYSKNKSMTSSISSVSL
mmetsp:Transcript_37013/g.58227  ORF Transcript_37013/g.58227 Transcript_37013/m.58227 type:complete len:247 (+) Transcript_37013:462-1202(+)